MWGGRECGGSQLQPWKLAFLCWKMGLRVMVLGGETEDSWVTAEGTVGLHVFPEHLLCPSLGLCVVGAAVCQARCLNPCLQVERPRLRAKR